MVKKDKKFDAPQDAAVQTPEAPQTEAAPKGPAIPKLPKLPSIYLQNTDGTQYKFTRFPMPKRAAKSPDGEFKVVVDGQPLSAWSTASKGWAADDKSIEYIWLQLSDGTTGYLTMDYGVSAKTFGESASFTRGEGKASREDPKRVPRDPAKEAGRITQFQTKMAAKKPAETPAETPAA